MQPPPLPHAATTAHGPSTTNRDHCALENLKSLLMKCTVGSNAKTLTLPQKTFIGKRIQDFLPSIHTPDHPPYAWMIENAIKQLNEEGGSTEEAISKFILEEHKDLPWAHAALLNHYLRNLSESDFIECFNGCYLIGKANISHSRASKPSLRLSCTTSHSLGPNPCPSLSLSPTSSPSCSSSPTFSSSNSSSSQSFSLKGKGRKKKRNYKRKRSPGRMQNARWIIIHPKYKEGWGRGKGRGMVRGRGGDGGIKEVYLGKVEGDSCSIAWKQ